MERLTQLIGKLNEQFQQNADPAQLLVTTQLIESELMRLSTTTKRTLGSSKVAVVMPSNRFSYQSANGNSNGNVAVEEKPVVVPVVSVREEEKEIPAVEKNGADIHHKEESNNNKESNNNNFNFDPLKEIPTLAHQENVKELNEMMANGEASLNDKLKEEVLEVGHRLTEVPVRDLKKAIGINDRYHFISELFRGDEVMYERSIKTINGFRIFPEAEYWIERELKIKLAWDENKPVTRQFYQLVKRRFS